jgi:hypothetical protein
MRRFIITCLTLVAAALLVLPAAASAAPTKSAQASTPKITRVQPMRVSVGRTLTITGRRFKSVRRKNTIIFRSSNGRTAFAKPRRATSRKLVLTVPAAVSRLLTVSGGRQRPTRLKLRVLAGKFSKFTPRRLSPVVTAVGDGDGVPGPGGPGPGPGDGGGAVCDTPDHDGDLLGNALELAIGTDPCLADTDKDQMTDGWEYHAAKDLNIKAVPYPGSRPFPNALDPSDGGAPGATFSAVDYDGDGLTTLEEYRAWRYTGSSFVPSMGGGTDLESALGYSDGTKFSRSSSTPSVPAWRSASYGLTPPPQAFPATYNFFGDVAWRDGERDADADGLSNRLESARGPSSNRWWDGFWSSKRFEPAIKPWNEEVYCGLRPGYFDQRAFAELNLADPDVDGDRLLDGEDDQDNDDVTNIVELYETEFRQGGAPYDLDGNGQPAWCGYLPGVVPTINFGGSDVPVNAMNPCVPNPNSRTCSDYIPF